MVAWNSGLRLNSAVLWRSDLGHLLRLLRLLHRGVMLGACLIMVLYQVEGKFLGFEVLLMFIGR